MKHKIVFLILTSLFFLNSCFQEQTPYQKGTSVDEVIQSLYRKQVTPLSICDYIFYHYGTYDAVIQMSNDKKTVLKSAFYPATEVTEADFSLIQSGMSPFEVISIVGTPISFEYGKTTIIDKEVNSNIIILSFESEDGQMATVPFFTYDSYLYCCSIGFEMLFVGDYL